MRSAASMLDRLAIGLSGLCLVHCLAGGVVLAGVAVAGDALSHEVHEVGLAIALPLAALALGRGVWVHRRWRVLGLGVIGIGLMAASLLVGHGERMEMALSVVGVSVLAAAHVWNMRAARG